MDPVTINRLLDAISVIDQKSSISIARFQSTLGISARRREEILRVLSSMHMIALQEGIVEPTSEFSRFINAWNKGELDILNTCLRQYLPYDRFLSVMKFKTQIHIVDESLKQILAQRPLLDFISPLKKMTVTAFETFLGWAIAVGFAHRVGHELYWAGERLGQPEFSQEFLALYQKYRPPTGYLKIGFLANQLCTRNRISIPTFERLFTEFFKANRDKLISSSSVQEASAGAGSMKFIVARRSSENYFREWIPEDGFAIGRLSIKSIKVV